MLAELCYNHLWFQNVPSPKRKPVPISSHPPQPLTTRNPLSVSVDQPVLDVSHQWDHTLRVLLCLLLSLSIVFSGSVHVVAIVRASLLSVAEGCCWVWKDTLTHGRTPSCVHSWATVNRVATVLLHKFPGGHVPSPSQALPTARMAGSGRGSSLIAGGTGGCLPSTVPLPPESSAASGWF